MNIPRVLELLKIEKECISRNEQSQCDRCCSTCDLVQDTNELLEMYCSLIDFLEQFDVSVKFSTPLPESVPFVECHARSSFSPRFYSNEILYSNDVLYLKNPMEDDLK